VKSMTVPVCKWWGS